MRLRYVSSGFGSFFLGAVLTALVCRAFFEKSFQAGKSKKKKTAGNFQNKTDAAELKVGAEGKSHSADAKERLSAGE